MNIIHLIIFLGGLQGILLAIVFLSNENFNKISNRFLALNLITVSLINIISGMRDANFEEVYPVIDVLPLTWYYLLPVSLYYFIQYLIKPDYKIKRMEYWLFAPFIIQFFIQTYFFFVYLIDPAQFTAYRGLRIFLANWQDSSSIVFFIIVFYFGYRKLIDFEKQLLDNYSALENSSVAWLKNICIAILVLWGLWLFSYLYQVLTGDYNSAVVYPLWIGISIIIYWLGYSTYSRRDLFEAPDIDLSKVKLEKPQNSLSQKTEQHYQYLLELIQKEELYKDPNLSMSVLAEKMDLSNGYLSQIINQKEGKNFFEFVNTYRVEAVKQILADPAYAHFSILGVGQEAGFKSKSTFNAVFKKMTGLTPTAYKRDLAKKLSPNS